MTYPATLTNPIQPPKRAERATPALTMETVVRKRAKTAETRRYWRSFFVRYVGSEQRNVPEKSWEKQTWHFFTSLDPRLKNGVVMGKPPMNGDFSNGRVGLLEGFAIFYMAFCGNGPITRPGKHAKNDGKIHH